MASYSVIATPEDKEYEVISKPKKDYEVIAFGDTPYYEGAEPKDVAKFIEGMALGRIDIPETEQQFLKVEGAPADLPTPGFGAGVEDPSKGFTIESSDIFGLAGELVPFSGALSVAGKVTKGVKLSKQAKRVLDAGIAGNILGFGRTIGFGIESEAKAIAEKVKIGGGTPEEALTKIAKETKLADIVAESEKKIAEFGGNIEKLEKLTKDYARGTEETLSFAGFQGAYENIVRTHPEKKLKPYVEDLKGLGHTIEELGQAQKEISLPVGDKFDEAVQRWNNAQVRTSFDTQRAMVAINKLIPDVKRQRLFSHALEQPDKFMGKLTDKERAVADYIRTAFDKWHNVLEEENIMDAFIDNYVTHIYKTEKAVEKANKLLKGYHLRDKTPFARARTIETLEKAIEKGKKPVEEIGAIFANYNYNVQRTLANKRFIDTLKGLRNEEGNLIIMVANKAPDHYVYVDAPAFRKYMYVGEKEEIGAKLIQTDAKIDPKFKQTLENIASPFTPKANWNKALRIARGKVKRIIMYNPLIHGTNVLSNAMTESFTRSVAPIPGFNLFSKGSRIWKRSPNYIREMVDKGGLQLEGTYNIFSDLRESLSEMRPGDSAWGKLWKYSGLEKIEELSDKILWQGILRNAQLGTFDLHLNRLLKKGIPRAEAMVETGQYVNNLFGQLPIIWKTRLEREITGHLFFAPNWTISNLRQATALLPKKAENMLPGILQHKFLTDEARRRIKKQYARFFIKGTVQMLALGNLIQAVMLMNEGHPVHSTFSNEEGHKFDIDTGKYDNKGRRVYVANWFFRTIRDLAHWGTEPDKTFFNKMEPILRTTVEEMIPGGGMRFWNKKSITHPGMEPQEKFAARLQHISEGVTPLDAIRGREGEVRTLMERLLPLTGTWIRKGLVLSTTNYQVLPKEKKIEFLQTLEDDEKIEFLRMLQNNRIKGNLGKRLLEFKFKYTHEKGELDKEIEVLLQKKEIKKAIEKMIKSGRYKTRKGIEKRIRPYINALI
jgi:hypothetical protein